MPNTHQELPIDEELAKEAKSIVALAFRNGPIEDVHAGIECEHCAGKREYSHITQHEMKAIMKFAVDKVYALLWIRSHSPDVFLPVIKAGALYTSTWDLPRTAEKKSSTSRGSQICCRALGKPILRRTLGRANRNFENGERLTLESNSATACVSRRFSYRLALRKCNIATAHLR